MNTAYRNAALWMTGWLAAMLTITVAGREVGRELDVFQIMVLRSVIGFLLLWPLVRRAGGFAAMRTQRLGLHVLRNCVHYGAQFGWFAALLLIPVAQVIAIEFTLPIWTALFAVTLLGERFTPAKLIALAFGLIGVVVIVRPGFATVETGQLIMIAAAFGFGTSVGMTKLLTRTDSAVAIIFWMTIVQTALGIVPALYVWRWPAAHLWPWILVIAFCGTFSHYCYARAMQHADATVAVPMDFLRVPLAALLGWLVYAERVDLYTAAGAALILTGNLLNLGGLRRRV
ncbi:DMT transporter permease [Rhodospirillales bacterium TMPK1]|uniref:DMT transporter permease n=2 Tax=Roseiterribacter gracilis TaxID=2812848 RepID=A0A8S8XBH1_9PROT|nr:DMT transporter permease [Rhodospirillales bacterium TMPK1]